MQDSAVADAAAAAISAARSQGLAAEDAVVLQNSNKLTVRLTPCDVVARVVPAVQRADVHSARVEIEIAQQLVKAGCPVGEPDPRATPRVHQQGGFAITLWTYYQPLVQATIAPVDYAHALGGLHLGMRGITTPTPHFTERVASAQRLAADHARTPGLPPAERELLRDTLRTMDRAVSQRGHEEQVLHGEPHPGNLLITGQGPRFVDLETCCRGPVEFDLAHAPDNVGELCPDVDLVLLRDCRILVLAMIIMWRWDRDDQLPNGRQRGREWLTQLQTALATRH